MKYILLILLLCIPGYSREIRIGVPDTGFDFSKFKKPITLCQGTKVYKTAFTDSYEDVIGHGTVIVNLIESKIHPSIKHCYVLVKMFHDKTMLDKQVQSGYTNITDAFKILKDKKVDIINLSYGGYDPILAEKKVIKDLLDNKILLITNSGNSIVNLDEKCRYYPACYDDRLVVVGDVDSSAANFGKIVDLKYNGKSTICPTFTNGCIEDWGTSYSTARVTGLMINRFEDFKKLINKGKMNASK